MKMDKYVVLTDSCSDLSAELVKKYNLDVFPMEFVLDGIAYRNYPDHHELDLKTFYNKLKNGSRGSTTQISPEEFIKFFTPYLEDGYDILYIAFSSALSGTYQSSLVAKDLLSEKYKNRKIICVDTLSASTAEGKLAIQAKENQLNGMTIEENEKDIREKVPSLAVWFTVDDLNCLKRGGRISPTKAFVGTLLQIKPVLHVSDEGKLVAMTKARGRKASLMELFKVFKDDCLDFQNDVIYISDADSEEDANFMGEKIKNELGVKNVVYSKIGPVIGMHSGPGTFLISYYGKKR